MNNPGPAASATRQTVFWTYPFRPFFLVAALWSAFSVLLWIVLYARGAALPSLFDAMNWHIHSLLFGLVYAAVAGFMLTAIANWTGRPPVRGALLMWLAGLWLVGRLVGLLSAGLPLWVAIVGELAFPLCFVALAATEILVARNWRNAMMPLPMAILAVADLLTLLEADGAPLGGLGWRLGIAGIIALISLIGGRIIPAFTRNWLIKRQGAVGLPPPTDWFDRLALAALQAGLLLWAFLPQAGPVGLLLALAGVLHALRLGRWRGLATRSDPMLFILHVAYLWIAVGALLLGASILASGVPLAAAVHAFTAGAIGTMILAVMPRVTLGHTGRAIGADAVTRLSFACILLAGLLRVVAAFTPPVAVPLLVASALLWAAAYLLFALRYGPMLFRGRVDA